MTWWRQIGALVKLSLLDLWRRNEVFGLLLLALVLAVPVSAMQPFGMSGGNRAAQETALLLIWVFSAFVSIGTGSRLFPPEFESRTALALFAKPVTRGRILLGKFLGAWIASLSALLLFYALFAASRVFMSGGHGLSAEFWQAVVLHCAFTAIAVAVSLFYSLLFSSGTSLALSALTLGGMFLFGRELPELGEASGCLVQAISSALYVLCPHCEFFDMRLRLIHAWGPVDAEVMFAALGYAAFYVAAALGVSAWILGRRKC